MSIVTAVRRCYRCGNVLQGTNPNEKGYCEPALLQNETQFQIILCKQCYEELHFNQKPAGAEAPNDFDKMLIDAKKQQALIVYLVDCLNFECSFVREVLCKIDHLPVVVVGSKYDLMPVGTNPVYLKEYIAHRFRVEGFKEAKSENVVLMDWTSSADASTAKELIEKKRKGKNVFVIGAKAAGKSNFITSFLRQYTNVSSHGVSISKYKNTDLEVWQIPLDEDSWIYDTPGTGIKNTMIGAEGHPKEIEITTKLVGRKVDVSEKGSLYIGLLARIDPRKVHNPKKKVSFMCYFAPKVELKSIPVKEDMNALWNKYLKKKAMKPRLASLTSTMDMDVFDITLEQDGPRDIGIAGLGWVTFNGTAGDVYRVYVPKNIGAYASRAKVIVKGKK